jgi:hypothetical protein
MTLNLTSINNKKGLIAWRQGAVLSIKEPEPELNKPEQIRSVHTQTREAHKSIQQLFSSIDLPKAPAFLFYIIITFLSR